MGIATQTGPVTEPERRYCRYCRDQTFSHVSSDNDPASPGFEKGLALRPVDLAFGKIKSQRSFTLCICGDFLHDSGEVNHSRFENASRGSQLESQAQ